MVREEQSVRRASLTKKRDLDQTKNFCDPLSFMHDRAVGVVPLAQTGQSVGETRRIAANIAKLLELLQPHE